MVTAELGTAKTSTGRAYREITRCRICGNEDLISIFDLGTQYLTGVFPRSKDQAVSSGPVELVKCSETASKPSCGLVQLRQSYDAAEMYGANYGYRSSLNQSMVDHLRGKVEKICSMVSLGPGDMVVDIGSNDATLLKCYPDKGQTMVGIDPGGDHFKKYYPPHIRMIPDFFSAAAIGRHMPGRKAKVVTSIAMFYDLESPLDFARQVESILADDGIWVLEQSYLPAMLEVNAYDAICQEHLEFYGLRQIQWIMEQAGLKIVAVELNAVNGGSFSVTVAKPGSPLRADPAVIAGLLERERDLDSLKPYEEFKRRTFAHRDALKSFLQQAHSEGKKVVGYGASTKGNVILQFCGITPSDIPCIGEVNAEKLGCVTPGTLIPIIAEKDAHALRPDYLIVFPWHFKEFILKKEAAFLKSGGRIVFPLPTLEIV